MKSTWPLPGQGQGEPTLLEAQRHQSRTTLQEDNLIQMPVSQYRPDHTTAQVYYSLKEIDKGLKVETTALHSEQRSATVLRDFHGRFVHWDPLVSDSCFMMVLGKSDHFCPGDQQLLLKVE